MTNGQVNHENREKITCKPEDREKVAEIWSLPATPGDMTGLMKVKHEQKIQLGRCQIYLMLMKKEYLKPPKFSVT